MPIADVLIGELQHEAQATRVMLARVPDEKLTWKPHQKSMSLGQLALHIATATGRAAQIGKCDKFEYPANVPAPAELESAAAIAATFEESVAEAKSILGGMDDTALMKPWSLSRGGKPILTIPRVTFYRHSLFNHLYHHRGQLSVYLRLLDIPVPSSYGPSADENPYAPMDQ